MLPFASHKGISLSFLDALFTSTSAVCVTGLVVVDTADTYTIFGRTVIAILIQIGGLGVASVGIGFIIITGKKVGIRERVLVKEALNLNSLKGIVKLIRAILLITLSFELTGAILSFLTFRKNYPPLTAMGISAFHAVSAFNNAGFDILGGFKNLSEYKDNILLNLTTCGLIIFGGLGFLVIKEIIQKRSFRKYNLHAKVVIVTTVFLLICGTILIKITERTSWLAAFFQSTTARTAGFNTLPIGEFTSAGLFVMSILMFIGASPGSTGGGIKTTTAFTLLRSLISSATNQHCKAFKRRIPNSVVMSAFTLTILAICVVGMNTFLLSLLEPEFTFLQLFFESTSAFGTVGLSTGITPELGIFSKLIIILTMFIGRLGPITIACMWSYKPPSSVSYSEESITIG
jgi:trk system potassium uptake protein TrkH